MEALFVALVTSLIVSAVETVSIIYLKSMGKDNKDSKDNNVSKRDFESYKNVSDRRFEQLMRDKDKTFIENELRGLSDELRGLSEKVNEISSKPQGDISLIIKAVKEINQKCNELEGALAKRNTASSDDREIRLRLDDLDKRIANLKSEMSAADNSDVNKRIDKLEAQVNELKITKIDGNVQVKPPVASGTPVKSSRPEKPAPAAAEKAEPAAVRHEKHDTVMPDKRYIKMLISEAEKLEDVYAGSHHYRELMKGLRSIFEDGDFDDAEEIMSDAFKLLNDKVYQSFKRVKPESIIRLTEYLEKAGYRKMNVRVGDDIRNSIEYWNSTFKSPCTDPAQEYRITKIHEQPYEVYYDCDGREEKLVMKGSCTFNKGA